MELTKPKSVAIVGMGLSHADYVIQAIVNGKESIADEIWGINAIGGVIKCDKIFMMDHIDDLTHSPRFSWAKECETPIITSDATLKGFKNLIEYPLEEIFDSFKITYFSNTIPYTIAYAMWIGVESISLFGVDYNYTDSSVTETGRGCTEFWLALAVSKGIDVRVAKNSTLLGTNEQKFYGYKKKPKIIQLENGNIKLEK